MLNTKPNSVTELLREVILSIINVVVEINGGSTVGESHELKFRSIKQKTQVFNSRHEIISIVLKVMGPVWPI